MSYYDLAEWLLEQIAEDERVASALPADGYPKYDSRVLSVEGSGVSWPDRWNPVLVLVECDAKRRIIKLGICLACDVEDQPCDHRLDTLRILALPYANRPGYREEWRP